MSAIAIENGKCVGVVATIPVKLKVNNDTIVANQAVDIVVSPSHRQGRTFFKLERMARDLCEENGSPMTYAFTVTDTFVIATRMLSFRCVEPVINMVKLIDITPHLQRVFKIQSFSRVLSWLGKIAYNRNSINKKSFGDEYNIVEINRFDERFDDLWQEGAINHQVAVVRDSRYLNWRYKDTPVDYTVLGLESKGNIDGFIVLKCCDEKDVKRGRIVDVFCRNKDRRLLDLLLLEGINYCCRLGVNVVSCWVKKGSFLNHELKKRNFIERSTNHSLIIRSSSSKYPTGFLTEEAKWFFTMGDSDFF